PLSNSQGVYLMGMGSGYSFRLNGVSDVYSTTAPAYDTWTHIVATYDGTTQRMYINGVLQNSAPYNQPINSNTDQLFIGVYYNPQYVFDGLMNNIMIFNRSLSGNEVQQLYFNPNLTLPPHPADTNNDLNLASSEFNAYNRAYKLQEEWSVEPSPPSVGYYTRAIYLYKQGGQYKYDNSVSCPLCWRVP
ncbi:MAG: LamG domain-containing protein, partial [Clostridiales bacterium]|nr:LamG domain-containing protein [Clostridiales bacterium]